jgi:hypothetical protein
LRIENFLSRALRITDRKKKGAEEGDKKDEEKKDAPELLGGWLGDRLGGGAGWEGVRLGGWIGRRTRIRRMRIAYRKVYHNGLAHYFLRHGSRAEDSIDNLQVLQSTMACGETEMEGAPM